jgi:hypothetical protein
MNKNIAFLSLVFCTLTFEPISASKNKNSYLPEASTNSTLAPYMNMINSAPSALSDAKTQADNMLLLDKTTSRESEFLIAVCTGQYEHLMSMPNRKNWLSNKIFTKNDNEFVNDFINKPLADSAMQDSPLHLAVRIAGYHQDKAQEISNDYQIEKNSDNPSNKRLEKYLSESKKANNNIKKMIQTIKFLIANSPISKTSTNRDIDIQNIQGKTPLHIAYQLTQYESALALLEQHANPNALDNKDARPFDYLKKEKTANKAQFERFEQDDKIARQKIQERDSKEGLKILSKIKITDNSSRTSYEPASRQLQDNNNRSQTIYKDNIAEPTNSISSDRTASDRSSQSFSTPTNRNRRSLQPEAKLISSNNRENSLQFDSPQSQTTSKTQTPSPQSKKSGSSKNSTPEVNTTNTPTRKNKPRPATASSISSRKIAVQNSIPEEFTTVTTNKTIDFHEQITQTNTNIKAPTAPQKAPTELLASQAAAQAHMAASAKIKASAPAKETMTKAYTVK